MTHNTIWIRLVATEDASFDVVHLEFVTEGIKHRISPLGSARVTELLSPYIAQFILEELSKPAAPNTLLSAPDRTGTIAGIHFEGLSVTHSKRPLIRLSNVTGDAESLIDRSMWAPYPKRHAVDDIAQDSLQTILLPTLNLAYALANLPSLSRMPPLRTKVEKLRDRIGKFDFRYQELRDFIVGSSEPAPLLLSMSPLSPAPNAAMRRAMPKDEMVLHVTRDPEGSWQIASIVCGAGLLIHKLVFNPAKPLSEVFSQPIGDDLTSKLDDDRADAHVLSEPDFVSCDESFAVVGLRLLMREANGPCKNCMIRFRHVYGVPDLLRAHGPWPFHGFPMPGPSPESLLDHCRSATDWARMLVGVADHAHKVSPEFLDMVTERLGFEVDLVKRNIQSQGSIAA